MAVNGPPYEVERDIPDKVVRVRVGEGEGEGEGEGNREGNWEDSDEGKG